MKPDTDRIDVPTNGRSPQPDAAPTPPAEPEPPGSPMSTAPFTPTQLAVGFAILASIVAIVVGRIRRRARPRRGGPFRRG